MSRQECEKWVVRRESTGWQGREREEECARCEVFNIDEPVRPEKRMYSVSGCPRGLLPPELCSWCTLQVGSVWPPPPPALLGIDIEWLEDMACPCHFLHVPLVQQCHKSSLIISKEGANQQDRHAPRDHYSV